MESMWTPVNDLAVFQAISDSQGFYMDSTWSLQNPGGVQVECVGECKDLVRHRPPTMRCRRQAPGQAPPAAASAAD